MELILIAILIPELLALCLGLFMILASLNGCGDFSRLIPEWKPRGTKVASGYWGTYTGYTNAAAKKQKSASIALPKIFKQPEYDHGCPDWRG